MRRKPIQSGVVETSEIDSRLQRYTAAEHRIGANLQELEDHSVYQLLTTDVLDGKTARALQGAKDANLWELFSVLSSALDQARTKRGSDSRLRNETRIELATMLTTDSVLLTTENIPLAERGLTGASSREERISIERLIDRMARIYEPIRDVVTHAETVLRDVLPRLNSAEGTLNRLRAQAAELNLTMPELGRIDETITRIRDLSLTDPLAIPENARSTFDQALHDAGATIAAARTSHDELAGDIARASDLLDECRELIERGSINRAASLSKIAQPIGLRRPPSIEAIDGPRGLAPKLTPIVASTKPWQVVRREIDGWSQAAVRLRDQLQRVAEANARPINKRDELRGRLAAFRAKMAATGFSEDALLRDISAEAHNELFTSPTDLTRAERLVTEFGNRLAAS